MLTLNTYFRTSPLATPLRAQKMYEGEGTGGHHGDSIKTLFLKIGQQIKAVEERKKIVDDGRRTTDFRNNSKI